MDCAGFVQTIQIALSFSVRNASNMGMALRPGFSGTEWTPHNLATSARCSGLARSRWADSKLAKPPTSRPPIALGCPVKENGPAPALPIWPVAKCRFTKEAFLAVPDAD